MPYIIIKNSQKKVIIKFKGNTEESIGTQAQEQGAPIPFSCGVGACRTCVCRIEKGGDLIEKEAVSPMHITVEDNELLSCIAGIKEGAGEGDIELVVENL